MKAYRIGRKQPGLWHNRTPPIRGGIFRKQAALSVADSWDDSETGDDDSISQISSECSCVDCGGSIHVEGQSCLRRRFLPKGIEVSGDLETEDSCLDEQSREDVQTLLSRDQFANERLQNHVYLDAREYPSLDPEVQADIVRKYRALHQSISDQGLYNCPYLAYGKEMVRYTALFAAFVFALRSGWYIASAVFLGLFWVCPDLPPMRASYMN